MSIEDLKQEISELEEELQEALPNSHAENLLRNRLNERIFLLDRIEKSD